MSRTLKRPIQAAPRADHVLQAIGLMCLYVGLIVFVNAGGKVLTASCHPFQVVFFRHFGAFVFLATIFLPRYGWRIMIARLPALQIARGLFGVVSSFLYFGALVTASLTTAAAISFTAPLIVTALSGPLLREKVGPDRWSAVAAGFLGALIIIRPGSGEAGNLAALMLVASAVCTGLYQIITRAVAGHDRAETTSLWTAMVSGAAACIAVPFVWTTPASPGVWALSLALGMIGGTGHFLLTMAFERGPASLLSPFNYLQLIGATITGFALYGALPDLWTWAGAAVIVAAGLYIAYRSRISA